MQPQYPQYPPQQYPQYPPQQYPQYPPQQYPVQYPQQAPMPPTVAGTLDAFFDQPSTGNKSWVFHNKPIGTTYTGIVARTVTKADVRQQTDQQGRGQTFRDGRPKFVMVVPVLVQPSQEFPEGQASWWVKGQARDELVRAMAEAGAPEGPPEAGAAVSVTLIGQRPIPGMNPAYQYRVIYRRPPGAPPTPVPVMQPTEYIQPIPVTQHTPDPWASHPGQPAYVAGMAGQPVPALGVRQDFTATPVPSVAPASAAQVPSGLTPEQQELLAKLTGG